MGFGISCPDHYPAWALKFTATFLIHCRIDVEKDTNMLRENITCTCEESNVLQVVWRSKKLVQPAPGFLLRISFSLISYWYGFYASWKRGLSLIYRLLLYLVCETYWESYFPVFVWFCCVVNKLSWRELTASVATTSLLFARENIFNCTHKRGTRSTRLMIHGLKRTRTVLRQLLSLSEPKATTRCEQPSFLSLCSWNRSWKRFEERLNLKYTSCMKTTKQDVQKETPGNNGVCSWWTPLIISKILCL